MSGLGFAAGAYDIDIAPAGGTQQQAVLSVDALALEADGWWSLPGAESRKAVSARLFSAARACKVGPGDSRSHSTALAGLPAEWRMVKASTR